MIIIKPESAGFPVFNPQFITDIMSSIEKWIKKLSDKAFAFYSGMP